MAKAGGVGCGGLLGLLFIFGAIINFCEYTKTPTAIPPATPVQTEQEKIQQKAKEGSENLERENQKKLEEQKNSALMKAVAKRFIFSELTVKDKKTGLVWTRNGGLYKYCSFKNTMKLINELNSEKYGGYDNWRLPSKTELLNMIDFAYRLAGNPDSTKPYVMFNNVGFGNVECGSYWSSTKKYKRTATYRIGNNRTRSDKIYEAWTADMCNGEIVLSWGETSGLDSNWFWPVRSER